VDLQRVSEPGLVASALGGVPDRCGNHRVPPRSEHRSPRAEPERRGRAVWSV